MVRAHTGRQNRQQRGQTVTRAINAREFPSMFISGRPPATRMSRALRGGLTRRLAAVAATALVAGALSVFAGAPQSAQAAPVLLPGAVKSLTMDSSVTDGNSEFRLQVGFSAPTAQAGDYFDVELDPRLMSLRSTYVVPNRETNRVMLDVSVTPASGSTGPIARFTFTDEVDGMSNISGSASWGVKFANIMTPAGTYADIVTKVNGSIRATHSVTVKQVHNPDATWIDGPSKQAWSSDLGGVPRVQYLLVGGPGPFASITLSDSDHSPEAGAGAPWVINCELPIATQLRDQNAQNAADVVAPVTCADGTISATFTNVPAGRVPILVFFATSTQPLSEQGDLTFENTAVYTSAVQPFPNGERRFEASQTYTQNFGGGAGGEATLKTPVATEFACSAPGESTGPQFEPLTNGSGVRYTVPTRIVPGATAAVRATLQQGYTFPEELPAGWVRLSPTEASFTHTFQGAVSCTAEADALPAPTITQAVCSALGIPTVPRFELATEGLRGVTFEQTGSPLNGGTVTVTATLLPGFVFPSEITAGWVVDAEAGTATLTVPFEAPSCLISAGILPTPRPSAPVCQEDGTFSTGWLDYWVFEDMEARITTGPITETDGVQRHTLIATANPGFGFTGTLTPGWVADPSGTRAVFVHDFELGPCDEVVPSPTPTPGESEGPTSSPEPTEGSTSSPEPTEGGTSSPEPTDGNTSSPEPTEGNTSSPEPTEGSTSSPEPTDATSSPATPSSSPTEIAAQPGTTPGTGAATPATPVTAPTAPAPLPRTGAGTGPALPLIGGTLMLGLLLLAGSILRRRDTRG
ncbi:Ig-like domain-containing protein [Mycetocola sp. BIGb0189]|uniref:Ig-like domain-containing protein n=1 Tax=Mycetocola sp. BIGb0189 TaxID=2940604 RepID=UPI0021675DB3|nr:Ig-like domain-containing protein [Mycetocola sp. BIGb0189]